MFDIYRSIEDDTDPWGRPYREWPLSPEEMRAEMGDRDPHDENFWNLHPAQHMAKLDLEGGA